MNNEQDEAKAWAAGVMRNISSGGIAGWLLVLTCLLATGVGAVGMLYLTISPKTMGQSAIQPTVPSAKPFALAGVGCGYLAFRVLSPAFYRFSRVLGRASVSR